MFHQFPMKIGATLQKKVECCRYHQHGQSLHGYPPTSVDDRLILFKYLVTKLHQPGCILSGFDFSIGRPYNYAVVAGMTGFLCVLTRFKHGR